MSPGKVLFSALAVVVLIATASAATRPPRVVSSDDLANYWTMSNTGLDATVPMGGRNMSVPGCATVSFVVDRQGHTGQLKVQRVAPAGDLGKVALSVASGLTFKPTDLNAARRPVFSWLIFPFNLPTDPAARTRIMQACAVDRLGWKDR